MVSPQVGRPEASQLEEQPGASPLEALQLEEQRAASPLVAQLGVSPLAGRPEERVVGEAIPVASRVASQQVERPVEALQLEVPCPHSPAREE